LLSFWKESKENERETKRRRGETRGVVVEKGRNFLQGSEELVGDAKQVDSCLTDSKMGLDEDEDEDEGLHMMSTDG
jgi:hypothetical protein